MSSLPSPSLTLSRPVVLIGMMGAGKTSVGRCLASRLGVGFVDADDEIEAAAGCSIPEIFRRHGEAAFRDGERRVIERLLDGPAGIVALGGGAFMDARTRRAVAARAVSVWLKGDIELLWGRVSRRSRGRRARPMLMTGNPRETLERLAAERNPVYAGADLVVEISDEPCAETTEAVLEALRRRERSGNRCRS